MNYKLHKLDNKLRMVVVPMPSLESATVTVWVGVGSRFEDDRVAGISHFLEHMVFKGSKKRPSAKRIAEAVDAMGGEFNASTSKEWTNFYIKSRAANIGTSFDVLADMVLNPILDADEIEREKGVIIEEIGMYEDTPMWKIDEVFESLMFGGNSLHRPIIGSAETVRGIKRNDFLRYRKSYYGSSNMVVTVAGGVDEVKVLSLAQEHFRELTDKKKDAFKKFKHDQKKPQVTLYSKKKEQAHFILGFRGYRRDDEKRYAAALLATILGGGMSSRLFTEVRERRGLAYAVKTDSEHYLDAGYIGTYAGVDIKRADEAVKVILDQEYGLASGKYPIEPPELIKAKEYLKGHMALSLEDTRAVNGFYGVRQLLLGKMETPEEIFGHISDVTIDEVMDIARETFVPEKLNLAVIGPYEDQVKFEKIVK